MIQINEISYNANGNKKPVIMENIYTGEKVAGFSNYDTGEFEDVMLIRDGVDLDVFMEMFDISIAKIQKTA